MLCEEAGATVDFRCPVFYPLSKEECRLKIKDVIEDEFLPANATSKTFPLRACAPREGGRREGRGRIEDKTEALELAVVLLTPLSLELKCHLVIILFMKTE